MLTKTSRDQFTILLCYVDDIIITGTSLNEIQSMKYFLHVKFTIKDIGVLKYILGIKVARNDKGLQLCQIKYVLDLFTDSRYLGCKLASTPMGPNPKFVSDASLLSNPSEYRSVVGKLMYLTITRPDISYVVQTLTQCMSKPNESHLQVVHRLLRYLKSTIG